MPGEPFLDDQCGPGPSAREVRPNVIERQARVVVDGHALARGEPILLQDDASTLCPQLGHVGARRRFIAFREHPGASHPNTCRLGDLVTERLGGLDPRRRLRRPERADAGVSQRIDHPSRERRLRADHHELGRDGPCGRHDRLGTERIDRGQAAHPRFGADRRRTGSHHDLVHPGLGRELPGQGVLPRARADDQGPRRRRHATRTGCLRIGRHARSMVWVRSGPTDTSTIGTPASSSTALT